MLNWVHLQIRVCALAVLSVTSVASVAARVPVSKSKTELKNFRPGIYLSLDDESEYCADDEFSYYEFNDDVIALGIDHLFSTKAGKESLPSDWPSEKGCRYETEDTVDVKGVQTTLTYLEKLVCPDGVRTELIKSVAINQQKVVLRVRDSDLKNPAKSTEYGCSWRRESF